MANGSAAVAKSKITNGVEILPGIDGRSGIARRYRDLLEIFSQDAGGMDRLSEAEIQLLRRASALSTVCELQEAELCNGQDVDLQDYRGSVNTLRRVLETVGIRRQARDITPSISEYVEARKANGS